VNDVVKRLIERSTLNGRFDETLFIVEQNKLPFEAGPDVRRSPEIAELYFGLKGLGQLDSEYYFWDNTTLCLKAPLLELVKDGYRVLEVGSGPAATLSIVLHNAMTNISITCAEINPASICSARRVAELNGAKLDFIKSNITSDVGGHFDVIFMNPPYVKSRTLAELKIDPNSTEGLAGDGGEDGCAVIHAFLARVPNSLMPSGIAILGVNTKHVDDVVVCQHIAASTLTLVRKYYSEDEVQPRGPKSQIYILRGRS
jgi:methylase of polypeptide subunit release factors